MRQFIVSPSIWKTISLLQMKKFPLMFYIFPRSIILINPLSDKFLSSYYLIAKHICSLNLSKSKNASEEYQKFSQASQRVESLGSKNYFLHFSISFYKPVIASFLVEQCLCSDCSINTAETNYIDFLFFYHLVIKMPEEKIWVKISRSWKREIYCSSYILNYISGPMAILWGYLFHCLLSSCSECKLSKKRAMQVI